MKNITQSSYPRQSKMLEHPASPSGPNGQANPMLALRRHRAVALVPTVHPIAGGYRVASSCKNIEYLVTQPNGHRVCTCPDYQRHEREPGFKCKHVWAVEIGLEDGALSAVAKESNPSPAAGSASLTLVPQPSGQEEPVRLKLIKNTKGYSWEISVADQSGEQALAQVKALEAQVRATFGVVDAP